MQKSLIFSIILHLCILLLLVLGLPVLIDRDINTDYAIVTDVVSVSELTNVKVKHSDTKANTESQTKKAPQPIEKQEVPKEEIKPETKKATVDDAEKLPKDKVEPKKEEKKVEKPKDTPGEEDKKKKKKPDDSFEKSMLKSLNNEKKKRTDNKIDKEFKELADALKGDTNKEYNPNLPMSISELDAIRSQIGKHWHFSAFIGAQNAKDLQVTVYIEFDINGKILVVKPKIESNSSPNYIAFVESAERAVRAASRLTGFSKEFYLRKSIELPFDLNGMVY